MSLDIIPVQNARDLDRFIRLPWKIYQGDENWVPPLISSERKLFNQKINPTWEHVEAEHFLAIKNGQPVGRISGIINQLHNSIHAERTGFFGFYECEDDQDTSNALLATAEEWVRAKGMDTCRGPANPSMNETCGTLVDGFKWAPFVLMTYNPRYYPNQFEAGGYKKAKDLWAYIILHNELFRKKIDRVASKIKDKSEVKIRNASMKNFEQELKTVMEIYNDAWEKNWGFVPMTDEEIRFTAADMKAIMLPELVYFASYRGETVGFSLALPDINHVLRKCNGRLLPFGWFSFLKFNLRKIPTMRVVALGVKKQYQHLGVGTLFYQRYFDEGQRLGYKAAEMSWILEDNEVMNSPIKNMGGRPYKVYRMYQKPLKVSSTETKTAQSAEDLRTGTSVTI